MAALLASALVLAVPLAHAQFNGQPDNDLQSANNGAAISTSAQGTSATNSSGTPAATGPVVLRPNEATRSYRQPDQPEPRARIKAYQPGEFELYVQKLQSMSAGQDIRRFGADLLTDAAVSDEAQDPLPVVPGDYIIRPGDEIVLTIWGSADANLRLTVDRAGLIAVPRVGTINVGGIRNSELQEVLSRRVALVFRNFQLTASVGHVRAIRVFVGGYAQRPGSVVVSGLSSVLHALMRAGGPSAAGSFRDIHLRRSGHEVAVFDLYDLLLKGDRNTDQLVQPDDIIFIGPVGTQVAVLGSVNQQAIFELRPGEDLGKLIAMAGGFNAVADRSRVAIERLGDRATGHVTEVALPAHMTDGLGTGDVVRVFSAVTAELPQLHQNERVHIEGEVARPGDYILPPGSRIADAIRAAGGMTDAAYPFGSEFTRESVRRAQEVNYERALRDLETDMAKTQASQRATSAEEINAQSSAANANARLLERLRQLRPTGRIVLQLPPGARTLPDLAMEDGDSLKIPARNSAVGVFGSVFNTGSFLFEEGHKPDQYLALAGGPTRGADKSSIFMVRANGSVVSARQGSSFWHSGNELRDVMVQPGDTIFVPEELNKSTFVQDAKDWTQILYQFGLGLAGIKTLGL